MALSEIVICILLYFMTIQSPFIVDGFWGGWFITKESSEIKAIDHSMGSSLGQLVNVPFEMRTADEKFLIEAQKFGLTLSNLDVCHHKVIMHLKKSCNSMTEEEIAKLSVLLLNCQSSVEERPTYPCTEDMTLAQCTKEMDQNTWNAYHIVSNRARAVCYATRQQEFTAKTEMTVNKLMFTAEHQLDSLEKIEVGQTRVKELTSQTLETMHTGQRELVDRQEKLKMSQQLIQSFVSGNLKELTREKALIAAGQKELSIMTELIQKKLDEASQKLSTNEVERQSNHQEILKDLARVQSKAKEMWDKIDNSTQRILKQHSETSLYYHETLTNLERINGTVIYLLQLMDQTRMEVDAKLGWLTGLLDGAEDKLSVIYCFVVHGLYFLVAAVTATFLQIPSLSRLFMSIVIPANALCDANKILCLDFSSLTFVLVSAVLVHILTASAMHRRKISGPKIFQTITNRLSPNHRAVRATECQGTEDHRQTNGSYPGLGAEGARELLPDIEVSRISQDSSLNRFDLSEIASAADTPGSSTPRTLERSHYVSRTNVRLVKRDLRDILENVRTTRSRSATPNRTMPSTSVTSPQPMTPTTSSSSKKQCVAMKRSGSRCRSSVSVGKDYCHRHVQDSP